MNLALTVAVCAALNERPGYYRLGDTIMLQDETLVCLTPERLATIKEVEPHA